MIKLSLQMSHITFIPIQISHVKYVVLRTQAIGLTSTPPQHHHIVQAIPISPSPPSPTSALPCVVFGFFQQSWVLWLNFWQILQKYLTLLFRFFLFADSLMWYDTLDALVLLWTSFLVGLRPWWTETYVIFWVWHCLYRFHQNICPAVEVFRILGSPVGSGQPVWHDSNSGQSMKRLD